LSREGYRFLSITWNFLDFTTTSITAISFCKRSKSGAVNFLKIFAPYDYHHQSQGAKLHQSFSKISNL